MKVFLTGATGYIGGRLAPRLVEAGHTVVCAVRDARKLQSRPWVANPGVSVVEVDAADHEHLTECMRGCDVAYYLIHSMMAAGPAYREKDRMLADGFSRAARKAGIDRIIYLGGLGETGANLSEHLNSRREVETALKNGGVPLTVFRAAMIIGSGSASFEILRYLVGRLPMMITPRWVATECQPIAVRNVLTYLIRCLEEPQTAGRTLDIGGPDVLTYRALMDTMAEATGIRKRIVLPVPVLTPRLSSLWIHLVTPIDRRIARPLAEGLRNRVVCRDQEAARLMPQNLLTVRESIDAALGKQRSDDLETSWTDAGVMPGDPVWAGGDLYEDRKSIAIDAPAPVVFRVLCRLGGTNGYFASPVLWRIRGILDRLVGGPGLSRGRRSREAVAYGDALDFWRVTRVEENTALELQAEMKLPGTARLAFHIRPGIDRGVQLEQVAQFRPQGLLGHAYWLAVSPFHKLVFTGMIEGIRREARAADQD